MSRKEVKTGQRVDAVKHSLLNPVIAESILDIPELEKAFSLIDIGSGDSTFSHGLIEVLVGAGHCVENLALVDADVKIFPDLIEAVTSGPINPLGTQVLEAGKRDIVTEFLKHYEEKYDLALLQLVLHQIKSDHEGSYLMYLAYLALKPSGSLLIVNLHPDYLQYLAKNEPRKFVITDRAQNRFTGTYHFDSSGSCQVYSRNIEVQLAMLLGLGFDFFKVRPITTHAVADQKPRYRELAKKGIPMFYLMQLKKNPANFISSTEGVVKTVRAHDLGWIMVEFADGEEIKIPMFSNWEKVKPNSHLILHEIFRKEVGTTLLSYWIVDPKEKVTGGQLVARKQH